MIKLFSSCDEFYDEHTDYKFQIKWLTNHGKDVYDVEYYYDNKGCACRVHYWSPISKKTPIDEVALAITDDERVARKWKRELESRGFRFLGGRISGEKIWYLHIDRSARRNFSFGCC